MDGPATARMIKSVQNTNMETTLIGIHSVEIEEPMYDFLLVYPVTKADIQDIITHRASTSTDN